MSRHFPSISGGLTTWIVVFAALLLQIAVLVYSTEHAIEVADECEVCDTSYYLNTADRVATNGLLFENPYEGYRSYLVPAYIAIVQAVSRKSGISGRSAQYAIGSSLIYLLASMLLLVWMLHKRPLHQTARLALATIFNPFLTAYVPFAMQESLLVCLYAPLIFIWLSKIGTSGSRVILLVGGAVVAWMIRSSLAWLVLVAFAYAAFAILKEKALFRGHRRGLALLAAVIVLFVGPQAHTMWLRQQTLNPYPVTSVLDLQISWGITIFKYATVRDEGHWRGLISFSTAATIPEEKKKLRFYFENPSKAVVVASAHVFAGFHYDQLLPYWDLKHAAPFTIWLLVSTTTVFFGLCGAVYMLSVRPFTPDKFFILTMISLGAASLTITATEPRFGLVPFALLSALAIETLQALSRARWRWYAFGLGSYLLVATCINYELLKHADILV